jgi:hypothetical protein
MCQMEAPWTRVTRAGPDGRAREAVPGTNDPQLASQRGRLCFLLERLWLLRHHLWNHPHALLGVGGQHTLESNQVQPRAWHQRCQPLHELHRAQPCRPRPRRAWALGLAQTVHRTLCVPPQHQVHGAVAPRCLELQLHLPCGVELHGLARQRRPGDATTRLLQPLAVVRLDPHRGVQAEPVDGRVEAVAITECQSPTEETRET